MEPSRTWLPDPMPRSPSVWTFGPVDAAIALGMLAATLLVCVPVALHLRQEANQLEREQMALHSRAKILKSTLSHLETRQAALLQLQRAVNRYLANVEVRPVVPWTTVVSELSQRRPGGVWTTQISGEGPRFQAQVRLARPDLAATYVERLRQSPYVEFATVAPAGGAAGGTVVSGRMTGD